MTNCTDCKGQFAKSDTVYTCSWCVNDYCGPCYNNHVRNRYGGYNK